MADRLAGAFFHKYVVSGFSRTVGGPPACPEVSRGEGGHSVQTTVTIIFVCWPADDVGRWPARRITVTTNLIDRPNHRALSAASIGAIAIGATAVGALAIGAIAVGRLVVGRLVV